ncbi:hypothetical protein D9599_05780 [Roseomonas sp. KE2513]|uniref:transposase n=1 Tax=Roseomonas sp. KE2513 TaxID=2479202 RepID=UPI0018DEFC79|nr:hypothetical protein [Roseomonas sp. KE2513]
MKGHRPHEYQFVLLERLQAAGAIDWRRAALDSYVLLTKSGPGGRTEPNGTQQAGHKRHLVTDARGTPLGLTLSSATRDDSRMRVPTLDEIPLIRAGRSGRPRRRPGKLHADNAYGHRRCRQECHAAASPRASPAVASRAAPISVATAGLWNGPSLGWHVTVA